MALFTDGPLTTVEELVGYESSLLNTARTEGIELAVKLELAQEEIGMELKRFLVQQGAVEVTLGQVVASTALKKWHTYRALALVYRDAYNSQLNDRHLAKWKEWERMADWAKEVLFDFGVGIVKKPIRKAAPPQVSVVAAELPEAIYYLQVSWVGPGGVEGAPSDPTIVTTRKSEGLAVKAMNPPEEVVGWNLYAGRSQDEALLQNDGPLAKESVWEITSGDLVVGRKPTTGQTEDYCIQRRGIRRPPQGDDPTGLVLPRG